ncbi:TPA: hypothetical protein IAA87_04670 [Candidatus Avigastranaerophilus faecigallinarum]|nr:hypothetical protein [Candidatus Avigastranaerophilus faecigallinarum]
MTLAEVQIKQEIEDILRNNPQDYPKIRQWYVFNPNWLIETIKIKADTTNMPFSQMISELEKDENNLS